MKTNHADSARKRLPPGFRLQSWSTALGTTWEIVDEARNLRVITGHKRPGAAVTLLLKHIREGIVKLTPTEPREVRLCGGSLIIREV